ncbi:hypothetical protein EVAR_51089_1 [Eumeta japonica]|uniref:Uncharacterized protein n=1 Tax=Eumeta variegata TaxID=151549 RepID=A0A4C1XPD5_EUMVA|nr:hypothetical protein EVAR_51089_1 [Eumeta japonica]
MENRIIYLSNNAEHETNVNNFTFLEKLKHRVVIKLLTRQGISQKFIKKEWCYLRRVWIFVTKVSTLCRPAVVISSQRKKIILKDDRDMVISITERVHLSVITAYNIINNQLHAKSHHEMAAAALEVCADELLFPDVECVCAILRRNQ